jgi:hypothetical protein
MKTFLLAPLLCIGLSPALSCAEATPKTRGFLIDPSKHYVYLKFDHVGDREPLSPDETTKGLWLRLVNNCRIPIVVAIFNTGTTDPGVGVYDEVVPHPSRLPILSFPHRGERQSKPATPVQEAPPAGYSPPDVISTTIISPGKDLLFSVPLNHVGPSWSLQIRFYLALPGDAYGSGPYSVVFFYWQDIPEKFREPPGTPTTS